MTERCFETPEPSEPDVPWTDAESAPTCPGAAARRLEEATDRARAAASAVSVAQAELVDAVREVDRLSGPLMNCTTRQWVAWQCGLTSAETRQVFALAGLDELPSLDAAFRAGELSPGITEVMARVATPENEAALLDAAQGATGQQLQVIVRDFRAARRAERSNLPAGEDPAVAPSTASSGWDDEGRYSGRYSFRPDEGAVFEAAIEAELARHRKDEATIDAEAENPVVEGDVRQQERPRRATRADALLSMARATLDEHTDTEGRLGEIYQVVVHHELDGGGRDQLSIPGCGTLDDQLAALVSCDATTITQEMILGFPVSAPTTRRSFNVQQRRAMRARDRTCRFPGCTRTRHLHAHHTDPYDHSRHTSVAEGMMLCQHHHWLVHHLGATITLGTDHVVTVTRRDGTSIRGAPRPPPPPGRIAGPAAMPVDRRHTGSGERLTTDARDSYLNTLQRATALPGAPG